MKLAILRPTATPDRKILGLVDEENEAILRGDWTREQAAPAPDDAPPDETPPTYPTPAQEALERARRMRLELADAAAEADEEYVPDQAILVEPADLYNMLFIGQHTVDPRRSAGTIVEHVHLLPYDHEQVTIDGAGVTILPLPDAGADNVSPLLTQYLDKRAARAAGTDGAAPRRRIRE